MSTLPTRLFQKRFDDAIEGLQLTFTDLLLLTESLDRRVLDLEAQTSVQAAQLRAQENRIALLEQQVQQLTARLDGRP